jgi:hypothetical protein
MKKLIFTLFLLLSSIIVTTAQDVNTALRYLKIANTLREVKQFDQSEEYLNKALGMVRGRNEYWEAAIYENLGFCIVIKKTCWKLHVTSPKRLIFIRN